MEIAYLKRNTNMDSGNHSGSLQSSRGGGDGEYDLRPAENAGPFSTPPPPSFFDPNSLYVQTNSPWPGSTSLRGGPYSNTMLSGSSSASFPPPPPAALDFSNPTAARNPKKRSRASRRAPTTVLKTDTTNFRAMVQEFTGIPSQPFGNSSFPPRNGFDLFGTVSSTHNRHHFTQKFQSLATPFLATPFSPLNSNAVATNSNPNFLTFKQQIPQNLPNPLINTLIQTPPKSVFSNSSAPKPHNTSDNSSEIKIGGLDEFGFSSEITLPNLSSNDLNGENWRNSAWKSDEEQAQITPINGGFNGNYSTSAQSNFHGANESENVALPGEGTTESWICFSE